jgi:hypothetical protein
MYRELENHIFEDENHYSTALAVRKPRYGKLEYKVKIHDRNFSTCYGKRWDRNRLE